MVYSNLSYTSSIPVVTDLIAEANKGTSARKLVRSNNSTLNTPYKDGLLNASGAISFIYMSSADYGTIVYIPSGNTNVYIKRKSGGTWTDDWYCFSLTNHNHDSRYYTESEVNNLLNNKAASNHNHDDRYYTESEINTKLNQLTRTQSKTYTAKNGLTTVSRLIGRLCTVHIHGYPSGLTKNKTITLCTLDSAYRPSYNTPWNTYAQQGSNYVAFLVCVQSNGSVYIEATGDDLDSVDYLNVLYVYGV